MPNGQIRKAYLQGFCFQVPFKKAINMIERTEISEFIFKGVVEKPS